MNFSNLGGMAASDCDNVMVVGPEAGNDFEDSIIAVSPFQKKRMNATTPEQVHQHQKRQRALTTEVEIFLLCGHGSQKIMNLKRPSLLPANIAELSSIITKKASMQKSI